MKPKITNGLSADDKEHVKAEWQSSPTFRGQLVKVLDNEIKQSLMEMRDAAKGDIPNLTEYYADELSKQRTLEWVKTLLV